MQNPTSARPRRIERHTIFPIPLDERHGKARQLFSLWFGANLNVLTIVTGALATTVFGQSFVAGALAIVLGNLIGTLFMALHAAQGPRLGVPQMVQSRGQFGAHGAAGVVTLVIFMYVGYGATALVTGGQSLHAIVPAVGVREGIAIVGVVSLAMAVYGHDLIHAATRAIAYISGAAVVLCYVALVLVGRMPHDYLTRGSFSVVGFLGMMSIGVFWQLGYAPYVSDYSRYLPPDTGPRQAFWASYWGTTLGAVLPMIFGALIGPSVIGGDVVAAISALTGAASTPIVVLFTPGVAVAGAICIYGGTLAVITLGQTFIPDWHASWRTRAPIATVLCLIAVALGTVGAASFLPLYSRFTELLLYLMIPWTAVNLVDYYWVRFGDYHVPSFFAADGGVYGRYNIAALVCYALGIVVQVPFIAADIYVGPLARMLGSVDLSWLVGLVVTATVYYISAPRHAVPVIVADAPSVE